MGADQFEDYGRAVHRAHSGSRALDTEFRVSMYIMTGALLCKFKTSIIVSCCFETEMRLWGVEKGWSWIGDN